MCENVIHFFATTLLNTRLVVLFAGMFLASIVHAGEVTLSWTAPTLNEDGTPLTDLAAYNIYYGQTTGGPYPNVINLPNPALTSYTIEGLSSGTYYFVATAINEQGIESAFSGEASKNVVTVPLPPADLTVSDETVYGISQSFDVINLFPIGSVPVGSACDGAMNVNGYYRVSRDDVTFPTSVKPPVVFALCSAD